MSDDELADYEINTNHNNDNGNDNEKNGQQFSSQYSVFMHIMLWKYSCCGHIQSH